MTVPDARFVLAKYARGFPGGIRLSVGKFRLALHWSCRWCSEAAISSLTMERDGVKVIGFPAPPGLGCFAALQAICEQLEAQPENPAAFDTRFLPVLDEALNKLIQWTECETPSSLRDCASSALVDRLRSLTAQADRLLAANPSTELRAAAFGNGDRRKARLPDSPVSFQALNYLREAVSLGQSARMWNSLYPELKQIRAIALDEDEEWLTKIERVPTFAEDTWKEWAEVVYDRMLAEQDFARIRRVLPKDTPFCTFKKAIFKAVKSNASKPVGTVLGITRPA